MHINVYKYTETCLEENQHMLQFYGRFYFILLFFSVFLHFGGTKLKKEKDSFKNVVGEA
jgi:hypothetical protein